ncbi:hypothetical protein JUN65_02500 [Gluconacetobacter azotocaptans]|uniref:SGNH/GDSL hydrolase family protein n=1 Tax=Gluconacetobacter azotocaptans TaxID=142834 RepID=UPI00195B4EFF|nr:GDSL-type esterase/lipase family protein [Gluconacetobacter azotocaptans]MBM9400465.1 hypothetical protein [Gluconacetobacter azotocaptans]
MNKKYILIGDSLIEQWNEKRKSELISFGIHAFGVGGQTSSEIINRIERDALSLDPDKTAILAGINDIAENRGKYNEDIVVDNLIRGCKLIQKKCNPVIFTLPPARNFYWNPSIDPMPLIISINKTIFDFSSYHGWQLFDVFPLLLGEDGNISNHFTTDGVHLSEAAYRKLEPNLISVLNDKN